MQGTYDVPLVRAGLVAMLVLLALPGTSIAGSASESTRAAPAAQAGPLQLGAGYAAAGEAPSVRALQRKLRALGWQPGRVDGLFGPRTERAVLRFQEATGLRADGVVGPRTRRALELASGSALRRGAGYADPGGSPRVRTLQRELRRAGMRPGPADGMFGPRTEAAVIRLQRRRGLSRDGVVDRRTRSALSLLARGPGGGKSRSARDRRDVDDRPAPTRIQMTRAAPPEAGDEWLVITALVAVLLGAMAGLLAGRPRAGPAAAPAVALARGVVAEGVARTASIGRFRGQVHALVLGRRGLRRAEEARYLISDPEKALPFWVDHEEVARLLDPDQAGEEAKSNGWDHPPASEQPALPAGSPPDETGREPPLDGVRALGYVSVGANGDAQASAMGDQAAEIDALCERRGWRLVEVVRDVECGEGGALRRPGLTYALGRVGRGEVSCLVVSKVGRLTNSAAELSRILELISRGDGRLVIMDVDLDTASEAGRVAANSLLRVGYWERRRVLENTRKGLAAARAKRAAAGRPAVEDQPALKQRIVAMRSRGMTLQAIADQLNEEGIPTVRGGQKWRPSSVQAAAGYRRPRRGEAVANGLEPPERRSDPEC